MFNILIIKEIQIKTTIWYHTLCLLEWLLSKRQEVTSAGEVEEQRKPLCAVTGNADLCSHCGGQYGSSQPHLWGNEIRILKRYLHSCNEIGQIEKDRYGMKPFTCGIWKRQNHRNSEQNGGRRSLESEGNGEMSVKGTNFHFKMNKFLGIWCTAEQL